MKDKLQDNRIVRAFAELRSSGGKALIPFITAGYPNLSATGDMLGEFRRKGVRICELGFPFSDPIADGPVIQESYTRTLQKGMTSKKIFRMLRKYRDDEKRDVRSSDGKGYDELAVIAMVSFSIVVCNGVEDFLDNAAACGFDGMIIPDLPLDEAERFATLAAQRNICNIMLIAPTTPPKRQIEIARHSRGFAYYISVAGITGKRDKLPPETIQVVAELKKHVDIPICVGFGISDADTVKNVCGTADGAIVGSAIVRKISRAIERNRSNEQLAKSTAQFVGQLLKPIV